MSDSSLNADVEAYLDAAAMNTPPPQIISDPLVTGLTPIEQLLRVLGLAANLSDPRDSTSGADQHSERDALILEAVDRFVTHDDEATRELNAVAVQSDSAPEQAAAPDQAVAMTQQLPQMLSSVAGAIAGALGGALQPLTQLPQQAAQGIAQAMQTGAGLFEQSAGPVASPLTDGDLYTPALEGELFGSTDLGGVGGGFGPGGSMGGIGGGNPGSPGFTAPTAPLGPPPVPSAGTAPSAGRSPITPPAPTPPVPSGAGGLAGMPMVPPGTMAATSPGDKDTKAQTKRLAIPAVRNGAPVQGRLSAPAPRPPIVKKSEGVPVVTRRIVAPHGKTDDPSG